MTTTESNMWNATGVCLGIIALHFEHQQHIQNMENPQSICARRQQNPAMQWSQFRMTRIV